MVRVLAECVTDLFDCEVDPLLDVDERVAAPERPPDLLAGHELSPEADEETQEFEWLGLKPDDPAAFQELLLLDIELERPEAKKLRGSSRLGRCS
jgi:hypothetical protein